MSNYVEIKKKLPGFFRHFAFLDDMHFSSASLFNRNHVRIIPRSVVQKKGVNYLVVLCDVRKKDVPGFVRAMEELINKMLLIGNTDYEAFCEELIPSGES